MSHEDRDLAMEIGNKPGYAVKGLNTYVQILDQELHVVPDTYTEDKCQVSLILDYTKLSLDQLYFHNNWIEEVVRGQKSILGTYKNLCKKPGYAKICWPDSASYLRLRPIPSERYIYVCRNHISIVADLIFGDGDVPIVRG